MDMFILVNAVILQLLWIFANLKTSAVLAKLPEDVAPKTMPKCGLFPGAEVLRKVENLQSFPGFGWDNLRNLPMAAVFDMFKYNKCRLTPDRLHVVPDFVDVIPVKETAYDRFAHYYKDHEEYSSATKQSINVDAKFSFHGAWGISGSFSKDFQNTKRTMFTSSTSVLKTSFTVHSYTLIAEPDAPLSDDFRARILQIGEMLRLNKTNMAEYLSEILVRDFGTNVITRVDAGAHITQEDFVDSSTIVRQSESLDDFRVASAGNFLKYFSFNFDDSRAVSKSSITTLQQQTKYSTLKSIGGLDLMSVSNTSKWFNMDMSDLVALDRIGDPIYWYISALQVPELPTMMTVRIANMVEAAVHKYYRRNIVKGCTDPTAPNYKYLANQEDGTCHQPFDNMTFGGMYQTCTVQPDSRNPNPTQCDKYIINNGISRKQACPDDYKPVPLVVNATAQGTQQFHQSCTTEWYHCWKHWYTFGIWKCRKQVCHTSHWSPTLTYSIYWCTAATQIKSNEGYLFGGAYPKGQLNPITSKESCPGSFLAQRYGVDEYEFTMCLSRDYGDDTPYSVPFAGFTAGSGVASKPCKTGYSQHLLIHTHDDDEIYVCVRTGVEMKEAAFAQIKSPPFKKMAVEDQQANMALHGYDDGRLWVFNDTNGQWHHNQDQGLTPKLALKVYVASTNHTMDEL